MKHCPQCKRVETDNTLKFCRADGATLVSYSSSVDCDAATIQLSPSSSDQIATTRQISKPKRRKTITVVAVVMAAVIAGVTAVVVGLYLSSKTSRAIESIAVMPFVNESADPEVEYLSDGMTEMLISGLSQIPNLSVKARSTVFIYKGKETTPKKIGDELSVQAVLLGRVAQRGDDVKLNLELVNAQTQDVIWSEQYNRKQADLVSLQSEIARDVLDKLQTRLSSADKRKAAKTYTTNSEAYQLYLKGRYYWNKRTAENVRKAMEQFQRAADIDPNYALAFAGLADCYAVSGEYTGGPEHETNPKTRAFAERALQLDDSLAEAHTSMAYSLALLWQWDRAEVGFKRAIELNPNYATAHHWYSLTLMETGRFEEAMREIKRAQELDPLSPIITSSVAQYYLQMGDVNSSIDQSKRLVDLYPTFSRAHQSLGHAYLKQGRYSEAIADFQEAVSLSPNDRQALRDLAYGYAVSGKRVEALALLSKLQANYEKREAFAADIAAVFAGLGDKDQAFSWLEKDFQARMGRLARIRYQVIFESLRSDPRYTDLLRRMGLSS